MAEEAKAVLIKKRGAIKAKLTKFNSFINRAIEGDESQVRVRIDYYKPIIQEFDEIQSELEALDPNQEVERDHFETVYFETLARSEDFVNRPRSTHGSSTRSESCCIETSHDITMPTINLPSFDGSYDQWLSFYDQFDSLINANDKLSKIKRFHYLKSSLTGEAANLIRSLSISAENYDLAWSLLKSRFENKAILVKAHVNALFNLPAAVKDQASSLRQLIDSATTNIKLLKSLNLNPEAWQDLFIVHLLETKLDTVTRREWDLHGNKSEIATLRELEEFILKRCQRLDVMDFSKSAAKGPQLNNNTNKQFRDRETRNKSFAHLTTNNKPLCTFCKQTHFTTECTELSKLSPEDRYQEAKALNLCINCLKGHQTSRCFSKNRCKHCDGRHHSLLHFPAKHQSNENSSSIPHNHNSEGPTPQATTSAASISANVSQCYAQCQSTSYVLLSTAVIHVFDRVGKVHDCRALIDAGSQSNFITQRLIAKLGLKTKKVNVPIVGINGVTSHVQQEVDVHFKSKYNAFSGRINCLVLPKITHDLPTETVDLSNIKVPPNVKLADPHFYRSDSIDLLIGAEIFWNLLCAGQLKLGKGQPFLQKTHFGWIVGGQIEMQGNSKMPSKSCYLSLRDTDIMQRIERFWKVEDISPKSNKFSNEELECEEHFVSTHTRNQDGRFIVRLPIKSNVNQLGSSVELATKRFYALERKLNRNVQLKQQYSKFLKEYHDLGHMELLDTTVSKPSFFLPHHAVFKPESASTKLRVVFDASAKSDTGVSLNDILMVGPTIQSDLFDLLIRFRTFNYVLSADIEKMYRQVLIHPDDRPLQCILWRESSDHPLKTYQLKTVTYGTASAPFLAIRSLHQLAVDELNDFPVACNVIMRDFYVDDLLTGSDTLDEAISLRNDLTNVLAHGGFNLRKWASNSPELVKTDTLALNESTRLDFETKESETKTLGLIWNHSSDILRYTVNENLASRNVTKRNILSCVAKLFDPLGLLSPIVITAKILIQQLWARKLDWDESVPLTIHTMWLQFCSELTCLNDLKINRKAVENFKLETCELHGFSDASVAAYAACIYLKTFNSEGKPKIHLLCAKTKVAPLKTISIPRLELCGALLLAQLVKRTRIILNVPPERCFYWTDSTIVLAWLSSPANKWKTFVANRVAAIQDDTDITNWYHVESKQNPADLSSRGVLPSKLINAYLWWHGPKLLEHFQPNPNKRVPIPDDTPELRKQTALVAFSGVDNDVFTRFSSFLKVKRTIAWCFRFYNNIKSADKISGCLRTNELQQATRAILKVTQGNAFPVEIKRLLRSKAVSPTSSLLSLNPFIDECGLIRVGGRLRNGTLPYGMKFPILLPKGHHITYLIIKYEHERHLHAGVLATLAAVRQQYWPVCGRSAVKSVIQKCMKCFRVKPPISSAIMGDLPRFRINPPLRPFVDTGLDFAGPVTLREGPSRSKRTSKAYISVFICLASKAVHLELVSNLSSEAFLSALKRFIARRGNIHNLYSDNATNFIGADHELKQLYKQFKTHQGDSSLSFEINNQNINWHFIPPRAPNFGGIWEAAVKAMKRHLKAVIGETILNFEEMYTLLKLIEACLNSRPLTPLSSSPDDLTVLTPGHFLIGEPLTSPVEPNLEGIKENRLARWQHLEKMRQHFWRRWTKEYLHHLQQRSKWTSTKGAPLTLGQMVLIKEDNVPALKWVLGRITQVHPGKDGVVRVASIRTPCGEIKRPITKLCVLPLDAE